MNTAVCAKWYVSEYSNLWVIPKRAALKIPFYIDNNVHIFKGFSDDPLEKQRVSNFHFSNPFSTGDANSTKSFKLCPLHAGGE